MHLDGKTLTTTCSKAELKALIEHASDDDSRPHVNSICFDLAKGCAVATDGHRLVRCAFDPSSTSVAKNKLPKNAVVLVPRASIVKALKILGEQGARIDLGKFTITDAEGEDPVSVRFTAVDAAFPPYLSVIPEFRHDYAGVSNRLCVRYFAALVHVAKAVGHERMDIFPPPTCLDPWVAEFVGESLWTVVIMPMRGDRDTKLTSCVNVTPRAVSKPKAKHPKSWLSSEAAAS